MINRIKQNYGHPIWNAVNQFVGGAIALISGFSVGREERQSYGCCRCQCDCQLSSLTV